MPTNNPTPEISSHANTITFLDQSNTITQIAYVDGSIVISDGQPVTKPPTITQNGMFSKTRNLINPAAWSETFLCHQNRTTND